MSEFWNLEELARKNALLAPLPPLRPASQAVLRCAECILSRPVFGDQEPLVTTGDVEACTGLSSRQVRFALEKTVTTGHMDKVNAPPLLQAGPGQIVAYKPIDQSPEALLIPTHRTDCERTTQQIILEGLSPTRRSVLACIAHTTKPEEVLTTDRPQVQRCTSLGKDTVVWGLRTLLQNNIIETAEPSEPPSPAIQYKLTKLGDWIAEDTELMRTFHKPDEPSPSNLPRVLKPRRPVQAENLWDAPKTLPKHVANAVDTAYPAADQARTKRRIAAEISQGVICISPVRERSSQAITFSDLAWERLDEPSLIAIAHAIGLSPLLFEPQASEPDIRKLVGVPPGEDLKAFVYRNIYFPLVAVIRQARQSTAGCRQPTTPV